MTYEEAIEMIKQNPLYRFEHYLIKVQDKSDITKSYDMAIEALEKQIPTTAKKNWSDGRGYTNTFICGKCGAHIQMPGLMRICEYEYCPWCGNRLE